ncbi:hypothetical protein ACG2F4_04625 [Halalkalibaculum sp. DA3122]|uniref:hypothetical protein n=1 Tax=unclassified Halalkalibaculum TaxID=2964617 RepID=UPI00375446AB
MHSKSTTTLFIGIIIIITSINCTISAQQSGINNDFSFGIQVSQYQQDFGIGITVTSPYFANKKIALRARGNLMFHEHLQNQETTWSPYLNATFGVAGKTGWVGDAVRLYGEGGGTGLFPSDEFSSVSFELGGYGLFGFEFYMNPASNYFIEIGAVGTGAKADNVTDEPIYSNGLTISTGFRLHL